MYSSTVRPVDGRREKARTRSPSEADGVQRTEAMRKARDEIVGQLAPQSVVPTELPAAEHVVFFERVEVARADSTLSICPRDVARDVVGDRRT